MGIKADQWDGIERLFDQALAIAEPERSVFLARACEGDAELRHEVESLIAAEQRAGAFIQHPALETWTTPDLPQPGQRIGAYELVRKIGEGGMSIVYLAVRADDVYESEVAVKLIRQGFMNPDRLRRFSRERQILARLTHPNIGRLYDGGAIADGLPYLVMEWVQGEAIDTYCERHGLAIGERLELFLRVCEAVRYAHRNLVVHRDLKPSNILVTTAGEPKLLDFGIAKLLDPEDVLSRTITVDGQRPMTPDYASPEQLAGETATTACDVYSLGVVLYKLLAGRLPYDTAGSTPLEIRRRQLERPPPPPSVHGSPRLAGDLDAIVLRTLRVESDHRYTLEQLTEDLHRYERGFAVRARSGTWRYRIGKFLRRNARQVAAASSLLAILLVSMAMATVQSARVSAERDRTRIERDQKEQVIRLFAEVFELVDPNQALGQELTVLQALERFEGRIGSLADQPQVEATLRETIGSIYLHLEGHEKAEKHLQRALEIQRANAGLDSPQVAALSSQLAAAWHLDGQLERAEALARESVSRTRAAVGNQHAGLLLPLNILVEQLCWKQSWHEADPLSAEALDLAYGLLDEDPMAISRAEFNRAAVLRHLGDLESALDLYDRVRDRLGGHWGEAAARHPMYADTVNNLAVIHSKLDQLEAAESLHREALAIRREVYGESSGVGQSLRNLATVIRKQGRLREAEALQRQAVAVLRRNQGAEHPWTFFVELDLYDALLDEGRAEAVERELRTRLERWREDLAAEHRRYLAWGESTLAGALLAQGRLDASRPLLAASLPVLVAEYGSEHRLSQRARRWLKEVSQASR